MSQIKICKQHTLDQQECRVLAEELLGKLVAKFGGSVKSGSDDYRYRHSTGINAVVETRAGELLVHVKMSLLTRAMAPQLEAEIHRVLDEQIG